MDSKFVKTCDEHMNFEFKNLRSEIDVTFDEITNKIRQQSEEMRSSLNTFSRVDGRFKNLGGPHRLSISTSVFFSIHEKFGGPWPS